MYTIFWIPTSYLNFNYKNTKGKSSYLGLNASDIGVLRPFSKFQVIDDEVRRTDHELEVKSVTETEFIVSILPDDLIQWIDIFTLKYFSHNKYGFISVKVEYLNSLQGVDFESCWATLSEYIYSCFKELFHSHQYHPGKDCFEVNNCPLYGYVDEWAFDHAARHYHKRFSFHFRDAIDVYKRYINKILQKGTDLFQENNLAEQYELAVREINLLLCRECYTLSLIEAVKEFDDSNNLKNSLIELKAQHNLIYCVKEKFVDDNSTSLAKESLQIGEESIRMGRQSVDIGKDSIVIGKESIDLGKDSIKKGKRGVLFGVIGVVLGLIGGGISLYSTYTSSESLDKSVRKAREIHKCLNDHNENYEAKISKLESAVEEIKISSDNITDHFNKLLEKRNIKSNAEYEKLLGELEKMVFKEKVVIDRIELAILEVLLSEKIHNPFEVVTVKMTPEKNKESLQ